MNITFWKRKQQQETDPPAQESAFAMKKRQNLLWRGEKLCATIPQKAVESLDINTKRFLEWQAKATEVVGKLCLSETMLTTRIEQLAHKEQYIAIIPPLYIRQHKLKVTKEGGPAAIFEWNEETLHVRIHLEKQKKAARSK